MTSIVALFGLVTDLTIRQRALIKALEAKGIITRDEIMDQAPDEAQIKEVYDSITKKFSELLDEIEKKTDAQNAPQYRGNDLGDQ